MPASSTSRWVTRRAVRGPSTDTQHALLRAPPRRARRVQRRLGQVQRHDVGAHPGRVHHPERGQRLGQPGARAWSSASRSMWCAQRVPAGRGEDAGLAHPAAQPLADHAGPARSARRCRSTSEPTGAPRPLDRQTDSVSKSPPYDGQRHPVGDVRVPDPGAVAVQRRARRRRRPRRSAAQGGQRDHPAAAAVVGLLDRDRPGRHRVVAVRPDHRGDRSGSRSAPTAGQVRVEIPP